MAQNEIKVTEEVITPEIAKSYLTKNLVNRTLAQNRVAAYAIDMKNNNWEFNGEAIQFNKSGQLINGQHRLNAIIKAGVPVKMLVMRDLADDLTVYDRGRNRSVTDSLLVSGMDKRIANVGTVAMAKLYFFMQNKSNSVVSDYMVRDFINKHQDTLWLMRQKGLSTKRTNQDNGKLNVSCGSVQLAVFYAIECGVDPMTLKTFLDIVSTGFYSEPNQSAAIVIRNDLLSKKIDTRGGTASRADACIRVENAIADFVRHYPRRKSYSVECKPIYSNNAKFKENL